MTDLFEDLAELDCAATVVVDEPWRAINLRSQLKDRLGNERASQITVLAVGEANLDRLIGRSGPVLIHPPSRFCLVPAVLACAEELQANWRRPARLHRSTRNA